MKLNYTDRIALTGGHLTPALAVLEELQQRGFKNFVWIGSSKVQTGTASQSLESRELRLRGIPFFDLKAGKLWRKWTWKTIWKGIYNNLLIPVGFINALFLLLKLKPRLVISFGGYLAVPVIFWSKLLGLRTVTHEQTVTIGVANKVVSFFADKILVSWPESLLHFPSGKTILVGNPIRKSLFTVRTRNIHFPNNLPLIYVTGGNQGANTINWRLFKILPELLTKANVIHQVGGSTVTGDLDTAAKVKAGLSGQLQDRYLYYEDIPGTDLAEIFHKADLILSRAGANSICEILAFGKMAILIPIPWSAHQEQMANASLVAGTGLGYILKQYDAMPPEELAQALDLGLERLKTQQDFLGRDFEKAKRQGQALVNLNAASAFADAILTMK